MMYLPRLCEHCLNPACVAACPSGAIYKREEDGIVLIDQDKCRGWRMCVSGCPYKKIYYNWSPANRRSAPSAIRASRRASRRSARKPASGASAISASCSMTPTASRKPPAPNEKKTSTRRSSIFLDPNDPAVIAQARKDGVPKPGSRRAASPVWKMAMEWKVAFPLHPEYRTLPMVWYVPPLSPIQRRPSAGKIGIDGGMPDVRSLRIPVRYLANLLTAGNEAPVVDGAGAHAGHARLHARQDRRGRDRRGIARASA
jgi:nitrate reductase beta subunit